MKRILLALFCAVTLVDVASADFFAEVKTRDVYTDRLEVYHWATLADATVTGNLTVEGSVFAGERGTTYYVDPNTGDDSKDCKSWANACDTMSEAFSRLDSGDTIYFTGKVQEQLTTPAQVFDVAVIGVSRRPRHADSTPAGGEEATAQWAAPSSPTASTPLVKVQQQGWVFANILWSGSTGDTVGCIQLFRDGGSGNDERDASHATIVGNRFQGGAYAIQNSGGVANVLIRDNTFMLFTGTSDVAIGHTVGAGIGSLWGWKILNNTFMGNDDDIIAPLDNAEILYNKFVLTALSNTNVVAIDLTNGSNGLVAENFFYSDDSAASNVTRFLPTSDSSNNWGPNYHNDDVVYGVPIDE
jgi:hypothetical protein